jgi:cytochrome c biogenesis factor
MSLSGLASLWLPMAVALFIALIADIGCFYRARLMYSATHDGVPNPNLAFYPSLRHVFLIFAAASGVYMFTMHNEQVNYALGGFIATLIIYGGIMYRDVIRASRRNDSGR